jgi:hypothetical protein
VYSVSLVREKYQSKQPEAGSVKRTENHPLPKIGEILAQTPFSRKTRIHPHSPAAQPLQGAQIAAQRHSNRRTLRARLEISALPERACSDRQSSERLCVCDEIGPDICILTAYIAFTILPPVPFASQTSRGALGELMISKDTPRRFWVVSPNVDNHNLTVPLWRQASLKWKAAFIGYAPDDQKRKQIGFKFANVVRPNDVLLIARWHRNEPEVVGCGVVVGTFKTRLKGFKSPHSFGSLRLLSPFKPLGAAPPRAPVWDALIQTTALTKLHPRKDASHKLICEWIERKLRKLTKKATSDGSPPRITGAPTTKPSTSRT